MMDWASDDLEDGNRTLQKPKANFKVSIGLDDNEKKSTAVYRDKLYNEIPKMKKKR